MELKEITPERLYEEFPAAATPYGGSAFNLLNAPKAEALRAFALFDSKGKSRLGVLLGLRGGVLRLPFSAPFGEVLYRKSQTLETCLEFVDSLRQAAGCPLQATLAPDFYDPGMLPRLKGAFAAYARSSYADYNYSYPLQRYSDFATGLSANARNHYNRALRAGFEFHADAEPARVYGVIRRNRAEHGYPLALSFDDLQATGAVVQIDYHLLTLGADDVAAAVVYRISPAIVQVIYWGDVAGFGKERPMNLLACRVADHYRDMGYGIMDIGPSSAQGRPDVGLCTFKESLGCELSFKPTFIFDATTTY